MSTAPGHQVSFDRGDVDVGHQVPFDAGDGDVGDRDGEVCSDVSDGGVRVMLVMAMFD